MYACVADIFQWNRVEIKDGHIANAFNTLEMLRRTNRLIQDIAREVPIIPVPKVDAARQDRWLQNWSSKKSQRFYVFRLDQLVRGGKLGEVLKLEKIYIYI